MSAVNTNGTRKVGESRPEASVGKMHDTMRRALGDVIGEATHQAANFVVVAGKAGSDRERYDLLVNASECLETAETYLGMLKQYAWHGLNTVDQESMF